MQPAVGDPASAGGLDWVTHRGPFQPLPCWDSVILWDSDGRLSRPAAPVSTKPPQPGPSRRWALCRDGRAALCARNGDVLLLAARCRGV